MADASRDRVLQERRAMLLDAAATLFLRDGFAATTVGAVAVAAGMSKKTVYQFFPSKLALLDALLHDRLFDRPPFADRPADTVEDQILARISAMGESVLRPENISLIRMIVADNKDATVLAESFRRVAVERDTESLGCFLSEQAAKECWPVTGIDPKTLASMLFGITIGRQLLAHLLRMPDKEPDPETNMPVAVRIFLRGLRAEAGED